MSDATSVDPYAEARADQRRRMMNIPELAETLGISTSLCYDLVKRGELPVPVQQIGHRYLIKRSDVDRYLDDRPVPTPLSVVPTVPAPLLQAMAHVDQQIAFWQWQRSQLVQQIAAEHAAERSA